MLRVRLAALVAERRVGVREVDEQPLDARTVRGEEPSDGAVGRHRLEHSRLDLEIPPVIDVAGLENSARGRGRIAAALQRDGLEERLCWIAAGLRQIVTEHVPRPGGG